MITSDYDEDEHDDQAGTSLDSSLPYVLESVLDQPFVAPNHSVATENLSINESCSSSEIFPQPITTNVSPSPTFLLDSIILKEVCENIFEDLTKLVEPRNQIIPSEIYEDQWTALRERVDYVMVEMKKMSQEAHNQTLHNSFKDVAKSMEEVELNRNKSRLYISDTLVYMDAFSIITSTVHSEDRNLSWLTKLMIQSDAPILEKLKRDFEQEQMIKQLEKELFEQKMMYVILKRNMAAKQHEFRIREEAQAKGYNELKEAMQNQ